MEKVDVSLNNFQMCRSMIKARKSIERKGQDEDCEIKFLPRSTNAECNFTPVEFSTLTNTRLLQYEYLSWCIGAFPASDFIFNAGIAYSMALFNEKFPNSFGSDALLLGAAQI